MIFKNRIGDINSVQGIVSGTISAIDNWDKTSLEKLESFIGACDRIIYTVDSDKQYEATIKLIEEYEPYIQEVLKVNR